MTLFPELEGLPVHRLQELFSSEHPHIDDLAERNLWLQEVAVKIAKSGDKGLSFLIESIPAADHSRLRAILLSFSFLSQEMATKWLGVLKEILIAFVRGEDPVLIAEAVDSLNSLGYMGVWLEVVPLLNNQSPYVVGSVLRYLSRHYPDQAKPILLESLTSREPIVRQNAIDELDHLGCAEAFPHLHSLLLDEDEDVRQAAKGAIANFENAKRRQL